MKLTRSCHRPLAILTTFALVAVLSVPAAAPAAAQPDPDAAALCSQHHGFGAQPVDVAKTADHTRVLAQVQWGYSASGGFCYLTLDPAAIQTLRNNDTDDTDTDETDRGDDTDTDETDRGDDTDTGETDRGDDTDTDETDRGDDTDDDTSETDDTPTTPEELPAEALQAAETSVEVRIAARWRADGRVEFALQQRQPDNTWGQHLFVRQRLLQPETIESGTGSWRHGTQFDLEDDVEVRIAARWRADGRVEFALQQRQPDNTWGQHLFVRQRLLQPETIESGTGSWRHGTPYLLIALVAQELPLDLEVDSFTIPEGPRGDDTLITASRDRTCAVRVKRRGGLLGAIRISGSVRPRGSERTSWRSPRLATRTTRKTYCTPACCTAMAASHAGGVRAVRRRSGRATGAAAFCRSRFQTSSMRWQ